MAVRQGFAPSMTELHFRLAPVSTKQCLWQGCALVFQAVAVATDAVALKAVADFRVEFDSELANDFNSAGAMGQFFSFLRLIRRDVLGNAVSAELLKAINEAVTHATLALGHIHADPPALMAQLEALKGSGDVDEAWIQSLIEQRKTAKASKDWKRADEIRDELKAKNIVLLDNKDGSITWKMQ